MPIIHRQSLVNAQDPNNPGGPQITLHPAIGLQVLGPVVQVVVGVIEQMAEALNQQGLPVPNPVPGLALIDTGASITCIDEEIARTLGIQPIDVIQASSGDAFRRGRKRISRPV